MQSISVDLSGDTILHDIYISSFIKDIGLKKDSWRKDIKSPLIPLVI